MAYRGQGLFRFRNSPQETKKPALGGLLADNPVRTIEQLISDTDENAEGIVASAERVEQFLQDYLVTKGSKKNAEVQTENIPEEPAP